MDLVVLVVSVARVVLEILVALEVPEILVALVAWYLDNLWVLNRPELQHLLQLERLAPQ